MKVREKGKKQGQKGKAIQTGALYRYGRCVDRWMDRKT
jgi:hypothetical protein